MKKIASPLFFFAMALLTFSLPCCVNDSSDDIHYLKGEYLCVSLSRLVEKAQESISSGTPIPGDIDTLFGMSWLEGYVIDKENQDIVLIGKRNPQRTAYHFEDLLVNIHNVFGDSVAPYCSLDPLPENTLKLGQVLADNSLSYEEMAAAAQEAVGGQQVVVGGVPKNSRHAKVMIYADYDMKKLSQGSLKMAGIRSTPEIASTLEGSQSSMSRFWFHLKPSRGGLKFPSFRQNTGVVFIKECPVVVLTEKQQMDEDGNLSDQATVRDEAAESFAAEMTGKYDQLALEHPLFCEMENLYRLQALLKAMRYANAFEESGINLASVFTLSLQPGGELLAALPGLVNYRISQDTQVKQNGGAGILSQFFIVAGGVSQEMRIGKQNMTQANEVLQPSKLMLDKRPSPRAVSWKASFKNDYPNIPGTTGRSADPSMLEINRGAKNSRTYEAIAEPGGKFRLSDGERKQLFDFRNTKELLDFFKNLPKNVKYVFVEFKLDASLTDMEAIKANIRLAIATLRSGVTVTTYHAAPGARAALFREGVQRMTQVEAAKNVGGGFWKSTLQIVTRSFRIFLVEVYAQSAQALSQFARLFERSVRDANAAGTEMTAPEILEKIRNKLGGAFILHIIEKRAGELLLADPPFNRRI